MPTFKPRDLLAAANDSQAAPATPALSAANVSAPHDRAAFIKNMHPVLLKALVGGGVGFAIALTLAAVIAAIIFTGGFGAPVLAAAVIATMSYLGGAAATAGTIMGGVAAITGIGMGVGAAMGGTQQCITSCKVDRPGPDRKILFLPAVKRTSTQHDTASTRLRVTPPPEVEMRTIRRKPGKI